MASKKSGAKKAAAPAAATTDAKLAEKRGRKWTVVRPEVLLTTFRSQTAKFANLQRVNGVLAGLYALQALFILIFGHAGKAPVTLNYLTSDPLQTAAQHKTVLTLASHHWFDVNLLALLVGALLLAAVFHALLAAVLLKRYEDALSQKLFDLRWWAYGLIGGLMLVLVALVSGMADVAVLAGLLGLGVVAALGALAVEANQKIWPWGLFGLSAAGAVALMALSYVVGGMMYGSGTPGYATAAWVLVLLGGLGVGLNLWLQIRGKDQWRDYLFAEEGYMAVNVVVLSGLAWVIFAGVLHG